MYNYISPAYYAGVSNMSSHYSLSPAVKIHRRRHRKRPSSGSQKDYQLLPIFRTLGQIYCHDVRPSVYPSICASGTGMHCDNTVDFSADLSLLLDTPVSWIR